MWYSITFPRTFRHTSPAATSKRIQLAVDDGQLSRGGKCPLWQAYWRPCRLTPSSTSDFTQGLSPILCFCWRLQGVQTRTSINQLGTSVSTRRDTRQLSPSSGCVSLLFLFCLVPWLTSFEGYPYLWDQKVEWEIPFNIHTCSSLLLVLLFSFPFLSFLV